LEESSEIFINQKGPFLPNQLLAGSEMTLAVFEVTHFAERDNLDVQGRIRDVFNGEFQVSDIFTILSLAIIRLSFL